jgi:hypothetical protein
VVKYKFERKKEDLFLPNKFKYGTRAEEMKGCLTKRFEKLLESTSDLLSSRRLRKTFWNALALTIDPFTAGRTSSKELNKIFERKFEIVALLTSFEVRFDLHSRKQDSRYSTLI